MGRLDPRVDDYIERAAPFARPLLAYLRAQVHAACPTAGEDIKWSRPAFLYEGRLIASMAAFKQHATFAVWQDAAAGEAGAPSFPRLCVPADLPAAADVHARIAAAMARVDAGAPRRAPRMAARPVPDLPPVLQAALDAHPAARAAFEAFPPSHRREYIEWIAEARREDTRARRVLQAVEWIADGKPRNWKYLR